MRVPEYSPYAVAEHTATLLMTLNRKTHRARPAAGQLGELKHRLAYNFENPRQPA